MSLYELQGYEGNGKMRIPVYATTTKMGYDRKGIKVFEYFKDNDTTIFQENKKYNLLPAMEDFLNTIVNYPEPVVSSDNLTNDYNTNVLSTMTPEEIEESKKRATMCAAGQ